MTLFCLKGQAENKVTFSQRSNEHKLSIVGPSLNDFEAFFESSPSFAQTCHESCHWLVHSAKFIQAGLIISLFNLCAMCRLLVKLPL